MAINDVFSESEAGVASGGEFVVAGGPAETGAAEVFELAGTAASTVFRELDPAGDGSFGVSVEIDSFGGAFHSQKNQFVVSAGAPSRLRVVNDSGGSADYFAVGMEVSD